MTVTCASTFPEATEANDLSTLSATIADFASRQTSFQRRQSTCAGAWLARARRSNGGRSSAGQLPREKSASPGQPKRECAQSGDVPVCGPVAGCRINSRDGRPFHGTSCVSASSSNNRGAERALRGDTSKHTDKQERKADHIAERYEKRGLSENEAERRAWATVNKDDGGGKKPGGSVEASIPVIRRPARAASAKASDPARPLHDPLRPKRPRQRASASETASE